MKKILIIFLLIGCAQPIFYDPLGNCRNRAIYCAVEAGEKYETVLVSGPTKQFRLNHAQAKAKINGEWKWLYMKGEYCYIGKKEAFEPLNTWKLQDFLNHLKQ